MEALLVETAKLALQIFFTNARLAGKSAVEIDTIFTQEKVRFEQNRPEDLPDV